MDVYKNFENFSGALDTSKLGTFIMSQLALIPIGVYPVLIFIIWYFFFNDRDCILALFEIFGKGVSRFSGKVVWLTGATTDLGEEMAYRLAAKGAKLVLSGRSKDMLSEIQERCLEKSKGKLSKDDILVLPFDITKTEKKIVDKAIDFFGQIDVLVINVSHMFLGETAVMDIEKSKAIFDVNFFGCIYLTKLVLRHFLPKGSGQILVLTSIAGKFGIPGLASYSASKHALLGFFDALRVECNPYRISVTVVCPGFYETAITDRACLVGNAKISEEEQEKVRRLSMKASRCAHLALVATVNKLNECWISNQPFLCMTALSQYFPGIHKRLADQHQSPFEIDGLSVINATRRLQRWTSIFRGTCIMNCIFRKERLTKIYWGKWPNLFTWKPLFRI